MFYEIFLHSCSLFILWECISHDCSETKYKVNKTYGSDYNVIANYSRQSHANVSAILHNICQSKKIYFSTKIYISIQKYLFQYKKKFSKKYKHIPSVFATRRQNGSESFKMADLNGYSKRSNHLLLKEITSMKL